MSVLVAGEGINLFLAGTDNAIEDFLQQLRADPRFAGLQVKYSRSAAQPFEIGDQRRLLHLDTVEHGQRQRCELARGGEAVAAPDIGRVRSEEHTSELQSLM